MSNPIDFYFDFSSPYGYFASTAINALAQKHGRSVNWHPVLLGVLMQKTGGQPLMNIPVKGEYGLRDIERTARFSGIPYRTPPFLPINSIYPARAMLAIGNLHGQNQAIAFAQNAFRALYVDGINIAEPQNAITIGVALGVDSDQLQEAMNSAALKEQFRAANEVAMNRGVFGSPFLLIDGEPFWGFDRFDQVAYFLQHGTI